MDQVQNFAEAAAQIVAAYVGHNPVSATELPKLIQQTVAALASVPTAEVSAPQEPQMPAVPIKNSYTLERIT